jgi:ABC-type molybdenum transport system ATPase subunit/photorepair protein PhrA
LDYNLSGFHKNQGRKKNRIDKSKDKRTNMHLFRKKKKKIVDNKTTIIYHHMSSHKEKDTIVYPRTWKMTRFGHWMVLNIPLKHCGQHPFVGM